MYLNELIYYKAKADCETLFFIHPLLEDLTLGSK